MKVMIIYPDFCLGSLGRYYEGVAIISAMLKRANHKVELLHLGEKVSPDFICDHIEKMSPDLIGFSSTSHMFSYVAESARSIKKRFSIPIICGGMHPTLSPEDCISRDGIDLVCRGEGEYAIVELCDRLERKSSIDDIQNIWVKKQDGTIIRNPLRPIIDDLDSLPIPDRDIFDISKFAPTEQKRMSVLAIRGCPYNCTYCCNHAIKKIYVPSGGKYIRKKSVRYLLEEIDVCLKKNPSTEYINFNDDILALDKEWFKDLMYSYKQRFGLPYMCNAKFDAMDEDIVNTFKETGCFQLSFGLESGSDYIRNKVLNRSMTKQDILKVARLCRLFGIKMLTYNMVGIPEEKLSDILDTVKINALIEPDDMHLSIFSPYYGTVLYDKCIKEQNVDLGNSLQGSYFERSKLKLKNIKPKDLEFAIKNFSNFVRHYRSINKLPHFLKIFFEKLLDTLWFCGPIYTLLVGVRKIVAFSRAK